MAITPYASFADVAETYEGTLDATDTVLVDRIETLCKRASGRLDRMVPSLQYRLSIGEIDPDLPQGLVIDAILRLIRNPAGTTYQVAGPFSQTVPAALAVDKIVFDEAEVHELLDPPEPLPESFRMAIPSHQILASELAARRWYDQTHRGY